jgi:iron complex outermembrane receptor protein
MIKFLLTAIGLMPIAVFSQEKYDTIKVVSLDKVIINSVRGDKKTPISQKTLTKKDIQKNFQGQEIPILLDKTTSIISNSDGGHPQGYTYFRIRGIDQTRINMTLNGAPLNEPEDQGVYTSNYPGFANVLQSAQIQRGVGTSTNGVSSFGGSISFQSQSGIEKESDISIGYGSFNTKRINISSGTGLSKKNIASFVNASYYSSDGFRNRSGGDGYSVFFSTGHYGQKNIIKLSAFTGKSTNQMAWLAVSEKDIRTDIKTNYNSNDASDCFKQSFIQTSYTLNINQYNKFSANIFYNRLDGSYDYFMSGSRSVILGSDFYGIITNYQFEKSKIKINIGTNLNKYNRTHTNIEDQSSIGIPKYQNTGYKDEASAFLKVGYDIKKLTIFTDLQYRYANFNYNGDVTMKKINWNFFNPKFGLIFNAKSFINYYASVGKSNREPTRTNLFGGQDNLVTLLDIKPEEVTDYEIGLNLKKNQISIQANLYYMDFKNEITLLGAIGSNGLPLMTNVTKSYRSGIEFDIKYNPIFNVIILSTNVNYSKNKIKDNGEEFEPLYTPKLVINQSVLFNYKGFSINPNWKDLYSELIK